MVVQKGCGRCTYGQRVDLLAEYADIVSTAQKKEVVALTGTAFGRGGQLIEFADKR